MMNTVKLRSIYLKVLLASVSIAALIGIIGILVGDLPDFAFQAGMTAAIFTCFSLVSICYLLPKDRIGVIIGRVGHVAAGIATLQSLFFLWATNSYGFWEEGSLKLLAIAVITAFTAVHVCLLRLLRAEGWVNMAITCSTVISALLGGSLILVVLLESDDFIPVELIGILSILVGLGTVVSLVGGIANKLMGLSRP